MRCPQRARPSRRGFTMVELLVVILIIAILTALLVPAIAAAVAAAKNAQVAAEQQNLQTALADFKNKYGEYPPSRIILHNNGYYPFNDTTQVNGTNDITYGDLNQRTVRAMRKYFPRAGNYFSTSGVVTDPTRPTWTNKAIGSVILEGDECLVFFLGGIPQQVTAGAGNSGGWSVTGFNRDPSNPFIANTTSRTVPLFEFAPQRLVDVDGDGYPSYIDPLSGGSANLELRPYAYFSAYGNNGYDPNDFNWINHFTRPQPEPEMDEGSLAGGSNPLPILRAFVVNFVTQNNPNRVAVSAPPNPYTNGDPMANTVAWQNPQTFQLISAGRDGLWGLGGGYDASSPGARLPIYANDATSVFTLSGTTLTANPSDATAMRVRERDNITNFAGGRLD